MTASLVSRSGRAVAVAAVIACTIVGGAGVAAADHDPDHNQDDGDSPTVDVDVDTGPIADIIDDLLDFLRDFTGGKGLADIITRTLFYPFLALGKALLDLLVRLLMHVPDVRQYPSVEQVHRLTLVAAYLFAFLILVLAGILYMVGPVLGLRYSHVNRILPRVVLALMFGTVSIDLLWYPIKLTTLVTEAFWMTSLPTVSLSGFVGLSAGLVLVWVVNSALLLTVIAVLVLRQVYILVLVGVSPLVAIAWSFPTTKKYADSLISGFYVALSIAPIDVLVLRFALALYRGENGALLPVHRWVWGTAALLMMVIIPYQLYGASQSLLGDAYSVAAGIRRRYRMHRHGGADRSPRSSRMGDGVSGVSRSPQDSDTYFYDAESDRYRRTPPRTSGGDEGGDRP